MVAFEHPISLHLPHMSVQDNPILRHVHDPLQPFMHEHDTKFNNLGCAIALVVRTGFNRLWCNFHYHSVAATLPCQIKGGGGSYTVTGPKTQKRP